jgi:glycosyltransferase involved in cell wall biosynthesis
MACGTPVLTSNVCALPEIVGDAGILVNPANTESITEGMAALAGSDKIRRNLRERGLHRVREFTWENTAAKIAKCLEMASS